LAKLSLKTLILYEDQDYIVINKPPFVSSLADRTYAGPHILQLARDYYPQAQAGHRLDKETSGAMALAKNPAAYTALCKQFEAQQVTKVYHAVLEGNHCFQARQVEMPIAITHKHLAKIDLYNGKQATTIFTTLQNFSGYTLVSCQPITGRMHQIRVHTTTLKAPIVGDSQYGGQVIYLSTLKRHYRLKRHTEERPLTPRVALHAHFLEFMSLKEQKIAIQAPYHKDFSTLVKQLTRYTRMAFPTAPMRL
jgi:23S rRNA pseudouridine955/2504/2580 synthase